MARDLNEYDILVRDSRGLNILKKVRATGEPSIIDILSADGVWLDIQLRRVP
jgi:site-specific DNA-methyltransferase (adenine-specific)